MVCTWNLLQTNEVWTMVPAQDALLPASVGCELVIGESAEEASRHNCGLMMYWNGRLIESYKRVGHFMENEFSTKGVLAVVNADFLVPNSNKQSFKVQNTWSSNFGTSWKNNLNCSIHLRDCTPLPCDACCLWESVR